MVLYSPWHDTAIVTVCHACMVQLNLAFWQYTGIVLAFKLDNIQTDIML